MEKWNRWKKVALWITGVLMIMMMIFFAAGIILQQKLPNYLKNTVSEKSAGLYQLHLDDMQLSVLRGEVMAKRLHLIPDTNRYHQFSVELKDNKLVDVAIDEIHVKGFKWLRFLLSDQLEVDDISIRKPLVGLSLMEKREEQSTADENDLWEKIPEVLHGSKVKKLSIVNLNFSAEKKVRGAHSKLLLENLNIAVDDIWFDKSALTDTARCWFAKDIRVDGKDVFFSSGNELYTCHVKEINASTKHKRFDLDSLSVIPKYTEKQWSTSLKYKQDRYDMVYPSINASGIDFKALQLHKRLRLDSIIINNATVKIFADKGMAEKTIIASNNFPSLAFQRLELPVTIHGIKIKNAAIYYKEFNPKSGKSGLVFFKALDGALLNVSNDVELLKSNPLIKCHFTTFFLGKPKLTLDLEFNMMDENGAFNYAGSLTEAPASFYNQLLEPITLARAEEGTVHEVSFRIKANRYGADVNTDMRYSNLKVAVLDASSGKLEKKGFLSLFVNWLAIKTNNPSKKGEAPRTAQHHYKHPQEQTFFNLMWKALYSGLKVNLGLPTI